jgi:hypothetical protein
MQSKNTFSDFFIKLVAVLGLASFLAFFSYLNTVFGWTNPSANPPSGSGILTAYQGKLGINAATPSSSLTVNGVISAVGNLIKDVATPISNTDAANKAYVDAQVGATGGGGGSLVLYGVGLSQNPAGRYQRAGGAIGAGCRGIFGGMFTAACAPTAPVVAGSGTASCPDGWTEVYAGYGPMNTMFTWYGTANNDPSGQSGDQTELDIPDTAVIGTDSICSAVPYAFVYDATYAQAGAAVGVGGSNAVLTACNNYGCNTCRVCVK